jgi:hypothetical protein
MIDSRIRLFDAVVCLSQFWDDSTHYEDSGENQVTSITRMAEWETAPELPRKTLMHQYVVLRSLALIAGYRFPRDP